MLKVILPAIAGVAIVGSGYAVWYFNGSTTTTASLNLKVTDAVEVGSLSYSQSGATISKSSLEANNSLVFDQTTRKGGVLDHGTGMGVQFVNTTAEGLDLNADDYTSYFMGNFDVNYTASQNNSTSGTVYARGYVAIPTSIATYITLDTTKVAGESLSESDDYFSIPSDYTAFKLTPNKGQFNDNANTSGLFTITSDMFKYNDNKEPANIAQYDELKAAINGGSVKFSFTVNYVSPAD
ncbi:MAG: hypothetical protein WCR67_04865 [Bacilli bacterium]